VGGSLLFYGVWLIGGYAALSWLGAVSMAATTALLLRSGTAISAALAALALPVIATRMEVRADAFTTALFAAFLAILWRYHETGRARLWVLPVLMVVRANAHPGFPAGLAVIVGYAGVEALELIWPERRRAAVDRLRRAWPWLFLCLPATGLNPFGWWIYAGVLRQLTAPLMPLQVEWQPIRLAWLSLSLHDANGAFTLTLLVGATAVTVALWHLRLGAAALLVTLAAVAFRHYRFEAMLAMAAVIVGGAVLAPVIPRKPWSTGAIVGAAVALACMRSYDLVTDYYPYYALATHFGSGLSPAFPERADAFIEPEGIPGPILNVGMVGGGYFVWQLGPRYLNFVDGRALPFSTEVSLTPGELLGAPPSAPVWRRAVERYGVNTVLFTFAVRFPATVAVLHQRRVGARLSRPDSGHLRAPTTGERRSDPAPADQLRHRLPIERGNQVCNSGNRNRNGFTRAAIDQDPEQGIPSVGIEDAVLANRLAALIDKLSRRFGPRGSQTN